MPSRLHPRRLALSALLIALSAVVGGCAIAHLAGGMAQNFEYQKQIEVLPEYDLSDEKVAVIVDADRTLLYEHPRLAEVVTSGVTLRVGRDVPGVSIVRAEDIVAWQWQTRQWNALPYGELAESLGVDRVVYIDITEYRLNPPGNRWLWEGVAAANVSVIEREFFDPDMFAGTFTVIAEFPSVKGVDRSGATADQIETGLLAEFIKRIAWLFHTHLEPKYPDKFRPELQ